MRNNYKVIISDAARRMLVEHASFIANVSEIAAVRMVEQFETAANSLKTNPKRCPRLDTSDAYYQKYHRLLFNKRYMIIYQIKDDCVYIDYIADTRSIMPWQ